MSNIATLACHGCAFSSVSAALLPIAASVIASHTAVPSTNRRHRVHGHSTITSGSVIVIALWRIADASTRSTTAAARLRRDTPIASTSSPSISESFQITASVVAIGGNSSTHDARAAAAIGRIADRNTRYVPIKKHPLCSTSMPSGPAHSLSSQRQISAITGGCQSVNQPALASRSCHPESKLMYPGYAYSANSSHPPPSRQQTSVYVRAVPRGTTTISLAYCSTVCGFVTKSARDEKGRLGAILGVMRALSWMVVALAACGGPSESQTPDASVQPDARVCPGPPSGYERCASTCGNSAIDTCYEVHVPGEGPYPCTSYPLGPEDCDGSQIALSCAEYGYYGGALACTQACEYDPGDCDACGSDAHVVTCQPMTGVATRMAQADPSTPGQPRMMILGPNGLHIIDTALADVASVTIPSNLYYTHAGVRGGWVVANAMVVTALQLTRVDTNGSVGPTTTIMHEPLGTLAMAYGPSDRTLVAWIESSTSWEIWFAILDANMNVVAQPQKLVGPAGNLNRVSATSDGTSFFIATLGQLHRIAADGSVVSTTSGLPQARDSLGPSPFDIYATATGGWFVLFTGNTSQPYQAQRFDTSGALVGGTVALATTGYLYSFIADGADLLATMSTPLNDKVSAHSLVRFDATGAIASSIEVGRGSWLAPAARFGANVLVSWQLTASDGELALVTP